MFFNDLNKIQDIAARTNFAIFSVPEIKLDSKNIFCLYPDEKKHKISVDMVREFITHATTTSSSDYFFIVYSAETMNEEAQNAFLKALEEPNEQCHFVLLTKAPSMLLPTILSRAQIYYYQNSDTLSSQIEADETIKNFAKRLIVARPNDLIKIATELHAKKDDEGRNFALSVVGTAIEILYKTYFATNNKKFLQKLPNLLSLYDNLAMNGNIKLHIVADML